MVVVINVILLSSFIAALLALLTEVTACYDSEVFFVTSIVLFIIFLFLGIVCNIVGASSCC